MPAVGLLLPIVAMNCSLSPNHQVSKDAAELFRHIDEGVEWRVRAAASSTGAASDL